MDHMGPSGQMGDMALLGHMVHIGHMAHMGHMACNIFVCVIVTFVSQLFGMWKPAMLNISATIGFLTYLERL